MDEAVVSDMQGSERAREHAEGLKADSATMAGGDLRVAFSDALDSFIAYISRVEGLSPETVRAYEGHLEAYGRWCGRKSVDALEPTVRDLRSYLAELKAARYAPRTIAAHLSALRAFFRWALLEGLVTVDAAEALQMPKIPQPLPVTIGADDMARLLDAPDTSTPEGLRDAALLELFYATGARISELSRLDVEDIDWSNRTARLFGKGSKERIVPIYARALKKLDAYLTDGRGALLAHAKCREQATTRRPLFVSRRGNRMDANAIRYRFQVMCRKAGLPADVTPHAMRHTFATDMLAGGADLRSVQELLGHASLSTTTLYTHLTPDKLKRAVHQAHPRSDEAEGHG